MKLYRFSPIDDQKTLLEAVDYVAKQATKLYFRTVGEVEPELINSLTIFSHYDEEFKSLRQMISKLGDPYNQNNGPRVKLHKPIHVTNAAFEQNGQQKSVETTIKYLRIRRPDPYRMQVGCCDLRADFASPDFVNAVLSPDEEKSPRLIKRSEYEMLEFFDPEVDVLAYVVSDSITSKQ
ncbi:MAG TPA: hypothetical protein VK674_01740 [Candidatus Limnocylindria bacterium]|nr:hypothetical protein [Candidatus Limnocylindria bacterium]